MSVSDWFSKNQSYILVFIGISIVAILITFIVKSVKNSDRSLCTTAADCGKNQSCYMGNCVDNSTEGSNCYTDKDCSGQLICRGAKFSKLPSKDGSNPGTMTSSGNCVKKSYTGQNCGKSSDCILYTHRNEGDELPPEYKIPANISGEISNDLYKNTGPGGIARRIWLDYGDEGEILKETGGDPKANEILTGLSSDTTDLCMTVDSKISNNLVSLDTGFECGGGQRSVSGYPDCIRQKQCNQVGCNNNSDENSCSYTDPSLAGMYEIGETVKYKNPDGQEQEGQITNVEKVGNNLIYTLEGGGKIVSEYITPEDQFQCRCTPSIPKNTV